MRLYNPRTNLWELPTHFKPRNTFVLDPIPLEEVLQRHPEEEYSPCYSTGELSETRYTVAEIAEAMQRESQSSNPKHPETHRPAMHYTNGTPKQGTAHCLNPATGKWELPTHYLAYNSTTETWSEPIRAEDAATLTAETILTPILTGRGYGEQTTAGALAAWLSSKPEIQEKPTKKGLMDILNTPIGEILSNPRPHPIGGLINGPKPPPSEAGQAESTLGAKPYIPGDPASDRPSPEARHHYLVIEHMKAKGISGSSYDAAGLQAKLNAAAALGYRLVGVCSPTFGAGAQLASMFTGGSSMHLQGVVAVMEKECNQSSEEPK